MANERRLRDDYTFGVLSATLSASDTTMSSAGLANLGAVDTYSYAALTLHNPSTNAFEIVWVTSHAAGATTATIVRACEGTTAQIWPQNTAWLHGPTRRDLVLAGQPRPIYFDDCDDSVVPDGPNLTNYTGYNAQQRTRNFGGNGVYSSPPFTFGGAPIFVEVDWSRITAGSVAVAIRAVGGAINLGIYCSHQSDNNDVIYRNGSATGVAASGTTTYDKSGRFKDKIMANGGAGLWSGGIEYGARGTKLDGSFAGVPAAGQMSAGNDYFALIYGDGAATFRVHRFMVIA